MGISPAQTAEPAYISAGGTPGGPVPPPTSEMVTALRDRSDVGDTWWYMIGPDRWIAQDTVGRVDVDPPPESVAPGEKWIEVDTFELDTGLPI